MAGDVFQPGRVLSAADLNRIGAQLARVITGTDGITICRGSGRVSIGLSRRDRGILPTNPGGGWEVGDIKLSMAGVADRIDTPTGYWWLFCDGGAFSATDYPALHTLFPTNYLPDFQVRYLLGAAATGDYDLDFEDDLGAIGNRIPVLPGVHHTHAGGTVTGHTGVSGDATDQVTGFAVSDGISPYLNFGDAGSLVGHHHVIPADALEHHSHPWTMDSNGNTGYESPTAPGGKWPPVKAVGVFILAKCEA